MPRVTSGKTASKIKTRIRQCDKFILLATNSAVESKWCNWELGYGDSQKFDNNDIAILPLKKADMTDSAYKGNEYISAAIDIVCGECEFCRTGRTNLCRNLVRIGFERDGSHEEYCVIPAKNAFTVDPTIPFEEITGIPDAVGCMYNGLKNQAKLGIGQTLLILGVGGLGMNAIQIAKLMGATVYATSRKADKLEVAKQMGADAVIDTSCEDLRTRVAELTNGRGVDVVLDNIGLEWSINEGVYMVRPGGKVLVCGYISEDFKVNYQEVMKFEKEILGMRGMTRQDMAEVVELVNQRKIVPYVYKTVPFEQINEALGLLRDGKTKGRVVLLFPED